MHVHTPSQAWEVFAEHPVVLLLMPVVGAFIGWVTKVLAIWMMFNPIKFRGLGPVGWQGQIPRRAAKFGSHVADIVLTQLVDPRELIDRLDPAVIARETDHLLQESIDALGRELIGPRWDQLPVGVRLAVERRAHARTPEVITSLFDYAKRNIDGVFDLSYVVTKLLIEDKPLMNRMVRDNMIPILTFMKRFGLLFGGVVGGVQLVVYAFTENAWVIPLFGLAVGLVSDWIALQMVFRPRARRRYLGLFPWHGMFFRYRHEFITGYAGRVAEEILTPKVIMDALMSGAVADRLFAMLREEVDRAIRAELGPAAPVVSAAFGSRRYRQVRDRVITQARLVMPEAARELDGYIRAAMDVESTAVAAFARLNDEEYEGLIRPVFQDDEWLVVWAGGGLGFVVGELQVELLTLLGGLH